MNRNILLLEPNYKNKYPPIGLMKIATYHKMQGDKVVFYKGEFKDFIINEAVELCIAKLVNIDNSIKWRSKYFIIHDYIKTRENSVLQKLEISQNQFEILILKCLNYFKDYYWKKEYLNHQNWDRVYIATLFTFYWDITIKTIEFAKTLVRNHDNIWVGGVMASVIPEQIYDSTGLKNIHIGLIDKPGILDDNDIIVDSLPLDYSILDEIEYKYPENNAYYGYTTRGCVRKCKFCAVPVIESKFIKQISLSDKIDGVRENFGEKRNLLLLDNNVLASSCLKEIIAEIRLNGFDKITKFVEPNHLEFAIDKLKNSNNEKAYLNKAVSIYNEVLEKTKGDQKQVVYNILSERGLLKPQSSEKKDVLEVFPIMNEIYNKVRNKVSKKRYVDFNQGVDARLFTKEKAELLSQIPIKPLRIAFDSMQYCDEYRNAISLAKEYGITYFSNYLLYNFEDRPIELYQRLKMNVELCDELNIDIYSFPMKFHPIFGNTNTNRDYIGKHWNRKFIRAVQVILNATKGKIGKGKSFFYKAFGKDEDEFLKLLYMPEPYLLYRFFFEKIGYTQKWWDSYQNLSNEYREKVNSIIVKNDFKSFESNITDEPEITDVLKHYIISRSDISNSDSEMYKLKIKFESLSKEDKYGKLLKS